MSPRTRRKMWMVEKYFPPECPRCRKKFENEQKDWSLLPGDIVDGKKRVRETRGYDIIICSHCDNYTARVKLESYIFSDRAKAERFLGEGFVNLQEVRPLGNNKDAHMVYAKLPDSYVEGIYG